RLHGAGGSMREIATALGLSHQRVHQIVGDDGIVEVEAASTELTPLHASAVATPAQQDRCSLCGAQRPQLDQLLSAPGGVFICSGCVAEASRVVRGASSSSLSSVADAGAVCTFCRNGTTGAGPMAGSADSGVNICASCVATCERMLAGSEPRKVMARRNARFRCSFCNGTQPDTNRLITGPGVFICNRCVAAAAEVVGSGQTIEGPRQVVLRDAREQGRPCQFCGNLPAQVDGMVSGGRGRICHPCLQLCQQMLVTGA
ncbi:MAG: hypothetical protein KY458_12660, partial [Actinobacteria bacterium]|nr:hypothetical protein [Actinomycetota bacterium]